MHCLVLSFLNGLALRIVAVFLVLTNKSILLSSSDEDIFEPGKTMKPRFKNYAGDLLIGHQNANLNNKAMR
jgi:hypothetical protein